MVDLVVGSVLFRRAFVPRLRHGHVDLPRLLDAGVDVIGFTIATRFPNRRGTLSNIHFASLGMPHHALASDMAMIEWFVARIRRWAGESRGGLRLVDVHEAVTAVGDGSVRAFIGTQGGHVLEGDVRNLERLQRLGVRTFGLAHLMDSELAGSGTGRRAGGLTGLGREAIAECERLGILVDLAHMSTAAVQDALPLLRKPFLHSHTGFTALAKSRSRWRRYAPASRNTPDDLARDVADAGGLVGVMLASALIGGGTVDAAARALEHAVGLCGVDNVALGSDFDGAIAMPFDVTGVPWLAQELLDRGMAKDQLAAVLGGNALRVLNGAARAG